MEQLYRSNGNSTCLYCTRLPFTLTLLFSLLFTIAGHAVTVNAYAKVTGITTVSSKSQLAITNSNTAGHGWVVGEEVIVIQMQDNVISGTINNASFGLLSGISNAGAYELAIITATTGSTITLNKLLTKPFHFGSNSSVQVVSFTKLSATNYTTTANITALPWSGSLGRGGVVAISVPGTLTLRNSIMVDGQGFAGGAASNNASQGCVGTGYATASANFGAKGEGIYLVNTATDPSFARGRARIISGGGGGNSGASGGGGGSNFSAGGDGASVFGCGTGNGLGGLALDVNLMTGSRVLMGGGGGGGQGNGGLQGDGGNGGGIIIIRAGALTTNCSAGPQKISANGLGGTSSGDDGAGGGGAAGTILLQIGTYTVPAGCPLTIQANGGAGGDAGGWIPGGAGGGGGQGALLISGSPALSNVTTITQPGAGGATSPIWGGNAPAGSGTPSSGIIGGIGVVLPVHLLFFSADNKNDKAVLTWTSADETDVTYTIERSSDGINFTAIGSVTGNGQTNYSFTDPEPLTGRVYYRLVMTGDLDSKTTYSSIVNVSSSNASQVAVAYPNPAHDHFYIRISGVSNKPFKVTVSDLAGQVVYSTAGIPANNIIKVSPGRVLKPGLYLFKVTCDGFEQSGKLMVQ